MTETRAYRLQDSRILADRLCWTCQEPFKEGDLVVCKTKEGHHRYWHRACFNWTKGDS
jgi:hypothetical protein